MSEKEKPIWVKRGFDEGEFESEEEYFEWEYENIPAPQDYVLSACGHLGSKTCVGEIEGDFLGEFDTEDEAEEFIRKRARKQQVFPNVWQLSDHGNWHLQKDWKYER